MLKNIFLLFLLIAPISNATTSCSFFWGFHSHKLINRLAVFSLPPEMINFYKFHIRYLTEKSVNPDKRRYVIKEEAARHYIDLDSFGDSVFHIMPRYWGDAIDKFSKDTLLSRGIVPWHVNKVKGLLTKAFIKRDPKKILRYSADIGHYIADAHVPLHTTKNYNGQLTDQHGIHGFWESRLPELSSHNYDLFVGKAQYIESPQTAIWDAVFQAHSMLDSVFRFEKQLSDTFSEDKKYGFEKKNGMTVKVYSKEFSLAYEKKLSGQVERQMKKSIRLIACFWYSCWVDAGQPDMDLLLNSYQPVFADSAAKTEENLLWQNKVIPNRSHEHK